MTTPATDWLLLIDPQTIFASPDASPWGSPMFADAVARMRELAQAFGRERTVITRFVADAGLGGIWGPYYEDWPFALVPDDDPLYALVPDLRDLAAHTVTEPTFGKWHRGLRAIVGDQPSVTVGGVATDCCVIATVLPAADAGARVTVDAAACAGSSADNHARALDAMALFAPQVTLVR